MLISWAVRRSQGKIGPGADGDRAGGLPDRGRNHGAQQGHRLRPCRPGGGDPLESFPFTRYGTIEGQVLFVSRDAVADDNLGLVYPARMKMAKTTILSGSTEVPLAPGMAVTVEIKTGKRRLIEYLLAPLQRYRDESIRER